MTRLQDTLQRSIASLRGLMTDLYPPDLRGGNVGSTIHTLRRTDPRRRLRR